MRICAAKKIYQSTHELYSVSIAGLPRWLGDKKKKKKNPPAKQETKETQVQSLGQKDPLEEEMTTSYSILAWIIPWAEEPGRLQFVESQRVRDSTERLVHTLVLLFASCYVYNIGGSK